MRSDYPLYVTCVDVLKNSSELFKGLDDTALEAMLVPYRYESWAKGAHLPPDRTSVVFSIIISGDLELTRIHPETGRSISLFQLGPGEAFDVISLLDGAKHDLNPVAVDTLELLTAPLPMVRRWMKDNPGFNTAFLPYLSRKVRKLEDLSSDLALFETRSRLCHLILKEAVPPAPSQGYMRTRSNLINTLSDEQMARRIGSVRAVVNRHIQEFTRLGLITTSHGRLAVNDINKLQDYHRYLLSN